MNQLNLLSDWISGDEATPAPGQTVLKIYLQEDGKPSPPIVATPIHTDGSHIYNGKYIYRPTLWWMPIPPIPTTPNKWK